MDHMRLPHDTTDARKRYTMPDPDALEERFASARGAIFPPLHVESPTHVTMTREDACALLALADGYLTLTQCELGQECSVGKLRDIWRARRAR